MLSARGIFRGPTKPSLKRPDASGTFTNTQIAFGYQKRDLN